MAKVSKLRLLQLRRRATEEEIARHEEAISSLKSRLSEFEITERVLASLGDDGAEDTQDDENQDRAPVVLNVTITQKPDGIPTMPNMIIEALTDARAKGQKGLEPREMALFIEAKHWPGMPLHIVGPTAWKMHKDGRLAKRQSKYFLIQRDDEGPDAETSEPSATESGAGGGPRGAASHPSPACSTHVGSTLRQGLFASTAALPNDAIPVLGKTWPRERRLVM